VTSARLRAALERDLDAMLERTATLVAIDSSSHDPEGVDRVSALMADPFAGMGFAVDRLPLGGRGDRVSAKLDLGAGPKVLVLGHADTVWPAGTAAEWPFERRGETASGPGIGDMKGCVVMAAHAIAAALDAGLDGIGSIEVLIVPDEELGSVGSRGWIEERAAGAGACLGLEAGWPGDGVVLERGAVGAVRVLARGRSAHSSGHEDGGASAVSALAPLVTALEALGRDGTSVSVGVFRGGVARQVVPDRAELLVDLRAPGEEAAQELAGQLRSLVREHDAPGVEVTVEGGVTRPALTRERSEGLWRLLQGCAAELGLRLTGHSTSGGADSSFAAALGIPAIDGLGPICHDSCARTERIEVRSLVDRGALMAALLVELAARWRRRAKGPLRPADLPVEGERRDSNPRPPGS
jgi:glutamate carboxypeptidase